MALVLAANAATVAPVSWKQSNALSAQRLAGNLSVSSGMDGTEMVLYNLDGKIGSEPTTANGVSWCTSGRPNAKGLVSAAATGRVSIIADLGASYDLSSMRIWNFQWRNGSQDLSNQGVRQINILVRDAEANTNDGTPAGTLINTSNPNFDDTSRRSISVSGWPARGRRCSPTRR